MIQMRRGWFHLASGAGLGRIFGFLSNLLLSRWLGPVDLGLFNLVTTTVQTTDILVRCGGDYALNFELGAQPEAIHTEHGALLARALSQLCSITTALLCISIALWVCFGQGLFPASLASIQRSSLTFLLLLMLLCEGCSASAWEILLVAHRTNLLALRQGLFFPLRLLLASCGALFDGVSGAMCGWVIVSLFQCFWLKSVLGENWTPLRIWPPLVVGLRKLLGRGLPFYASNLLASLIFFPLLIKLAADSGLAQIGYLRVGQILQQLFAFLPATFVPVLFLRLRAESDFGRQVSLLEKPLRIIWLLLLEVLLLYCALDNILIQSLFGGTFLSALLPTRLLLLTSLFECLCQLVVQPLLAAGLTRLYGFWQNGAAILSAILGWLWIPDAGLSAYLLVRLLYVIIPLIGFGYPVLKQMHEPEKNLSLVFVSAFVLILFILQGLNITEFVLTPALSILAFLLIAFLHRQDHSSMHKTLMSRN